MALQDLREALGQNEEDDLEDDDIEVSFEDDAEDVEIIDEREPEDRRDPVDLQDVYEKDVELSKEDLEGVSDAVRQRLRHLKWQANEERRQREAAVRRESEAFRVAKALKERYDLTTSQLRDYQKAFLESNNRLNSTQLQAANAALAAAYEEGDPTKIAEAQANLTRAVVAEGNSKQQAQRFEAEQKRRPQPKPEQQEQPSVEQIANRQPSSRAQEWGRKNPWFGQDEELTSLAYGIHERLVLREGVQPDSDEYYNKLDQRLARYAPQLRGETPASVDDTMKEGEAKPSGERKQPRTRSRSPVAPTGRSNGAAPKGKVTLTLSQKQTADRLGISYKQYARELLKIERQGG